MKYSHFVVRRDNAGPSTKRGDGTAWNGALEAQNLYLKHQEEIGITIVPVDHLHYVPESIRRLKYSSKTTYELNGTSKDSRTSKMLKSWQ